MTKHTFDHKYKEFQVLVATSEDKYVIWLKSIELNKLWLVYDEGVVGGME